MRLLQSRTFVGGLVVVALLCGAAALAVASIVKASSGWGSTSGTGGSLATVALPPELDRVLRDYERHWAAGDEAGLASLFTDDALLLPSAFPAVRGRAAIRQAYADVVVPVRLRAVAYAASDSVGYVVGAQTYEGMDREAGKFVFALRRAPGGPWRIAAEIQNTGHITEPPASAASAPSSR